MSNSRDAAYEKGRADEKSHETGSQASGIVHDIVEVLSPCYNPPSTNQEAYRAGWNDQKKESHGR